MGAEPEAQVPKILVVEDEADTRLLVRAILDAGPRRYEVMDAAGGEQALAMVGHFLPDLVLLDIVLPDTDGVEVLRTLKRNPVTRNTKVILVSARADQRMITTGLALGADDYLTKPFTQEKLLSIVERFLSP